METTIKPAWLNIKDASTYAGVCHGTFKLWMEQGLKFSKIGRRYLVKRESIDAFLKEFEGDSVDMAAIEKKVLEGLRR